MIEEISAVAEKWYEIGTAFRLSPAFLKELKEQGKGTGQSLQEVITLWLGGGSAKPTWEEMRNALRSEGVGEQALAEQLDSKYSIGDKTSGKDFGSAYCGVLYLEFMQSWYDS